MLKTINGEVYDPMHGINGEVRDIYVADGKIIAHSPEEAQVIDANGMVIMPGGVELHAHVAGPKVNAGRKMRPEDHRQIVIPRTPITRSGTGHTVPFVRQSAANRYPNRQLPEYPKYRVEPLSLPAKSPAVDFRGSQRG
jgi:formylmethanofuran dehydrogenase subunit A